MNAYRTTKLNEAVELIYSIDAAFRELEKGQAPDFERLYQRGEPDWNILEHFHGRFEKISK